MTNEDPDAPTGLGSPRRPSRPSIGGSPAGSTLSIVLAVVAVVVGFLILRNITDSDSGGTVVGGAPSDTVADTVDSSSTSTSTTLPQRVTAGATVVVANASGIGRSAAGMTDELEALGYTMGTPVNATTEDKTASVVHYDPGMTGALEVAESVARDMGGLTVSELPTPVPVEGASLDGGGVLVMLGADEAGKTIEELTPTGNVAAPAVSGDTTGSGTTATGG